MNPIIRAALFCTLITPATLPGSEKKITSQEIKINDQTVKDCDGNVYHTITIGTQVWMLENLKTTKYRDCSPIPNVKADAAWEALTTGAYCDYKNVEKNSSTYGRLYNWYAIGDKRGIAPAGWHVPTNDEFKILAAYLGGDAVAGGKLKEGGFRIGHRPIKMQATAVDLQHYRVETVQKAVPFMHWDNMAISGRLRRMEAIPKGPIIAIFYCIVEHLKMTILIQRVQDFLSVA